MNLIQLHLFYRIHFTLLPLKLASELSSHSPCLYEIILILLHLVLQSLLVLYDILAQSFHIFLQLLNCYFLFDFLPFLFLFISFQHSLSVSPSLLFLSELIFCLLSQISLPVSFFLSLFPLLSPFSFKLFYILGRVLLILRNLLMEIFNFLVF